MKKIRVPGIFVTVFIVALLFGVLPIIEVPCPVCDGIGELTGTKGLQVKGIDRELVSFKVFDTACGYEWGKFIYAVNLSVLNQGTTPSYGYIVVTFYQNTIDVKGIEYELEDPELGYPVANNLIYVEIPAETAVNLDEILSFEGFAFFGFYGARGELHDLSVKMAGDVTCTYCGGKGKLPLIEWIKMIFR